MCWTNIKLILIRELRDQLRDRRTLFTVVVLPLLLYPFMGISLIQVTQFFREHTTRIWLIGAGNLPQRPALLENGQIAPAWLGADQPRLLDLQFSEDDEGELSHLVEQFKRLNGQSGASDLIDQFVQKQMLDRNVDLAIIIPQPIDSAPLVESGDVPANVFLFVNSASDKSRIAHERMQRVLTRWQTGILEARLIEQNLSRQAAQPVVISAADVARKSERQAAAWSKILPLMIVIWCLTGAFYPAIDLCAGEKERGTFETLLSSPASRTEIALGKLLTVMVFSVSTALLNLVSMGFTSTFVLSRISQLPGTTSILATFGPPPLASAFWLGLAIIPVAALFSAVSLAAAAFARSSKEGQYYLVPLIMASLPLMLLPMLPAAKLDLGNSFIPVTNVMLLLRALIEGRTEQVTPYLALVALTTILAVAVAVRWVVYQFNSESVLFRASERFGLGKWLAHVFKERGEMPALGHALMCGVLILIMKFFVSFAASMPDTWLQFARQTLIIQLATVAIPAVLMAIMLTRRPGRALKLVRCRLSYLAAGVFLAVCLHPAFMAISRGVLQIYPPSEHLDAMNSLMGNLLQNPPSLWLLIGIMAIIPAILEELAFRGFILSGAESAGNQWVAMVLASLFFGATHAVFQQSVITFFVGLVLGFLAVRTGSLWPCMIYHAVHNSLTVVSARWSESGWPPSLSWLAQVSDEGSLRYNVLPAWMLTLMGIALLFWIWQSTMDQRRVGGEWIGLKWLSAWGRGARQNMA